MTSEVQERNASKTLQVQCDESKSKILLCGDVEGKFNALFKKVNFLVKDKGAFDILLCVGNFFGVNNKEFKAYKDGVKKVNIPTYILGPNKEEHQHLYPEDGSQLCDNVHYLGKRGLYTTSSGLKIAYISGIFSKEKLANSFNFSLDDAIYLSDICNKGSARGIDVLITSQWPNGVMKYDNNYKLNTAVNLHTDATAWLAMKIRPRYHVSGLEGMFYERVPYRLGNSAENTATRFLGLARVDNPNKEKWLYGLSLMPIDKIPFQKLSERTTDETQIPFDMSHLESVLFNTKRNSTAPQQYFYDMNPEGTNEKKKAKRQKVEFDQNKCWFCLASSVVEKHLVIAVGTLTYLVLAKGGLVNDHLLICPIEHFQSTISLPNPVREEIEQFKEALRKLYKSKEMEPVYFERNYRTSHMQVQVVPIPTAAKKELKEIFKEEAVGHGFTLNELDDCNHLDQVLPKGSPYFYVELPSNEILYVRIQSATHFPINFARQVLAMGPILNLPEKIDWKECELKKENEENIVQSLRKAFEPFDFTM